MSGYKELRINELKKFLMAFSKVSTLEYRNNKWVGLNREGKPFVVHVKHGSTRKYSHKLIKAIARDLGVSKEEFDSWYYNNR